MSAHISAPLLGLTWIVPSETWTCFFPDRLPSVPGSGPCTLIPGNVFLNGNTVNEPVFLLLTQHIFSGSLSAYMLSSTSPTPTPTPHFASNLCDLV